MRGGARKRVGVREGERLTDRNARTVIFRDKIYAAVSHWRASSEYQQNEIERPGRNREHDGTTTVQASAGNARARSRDPHTRRRADALFRSSAMAAEEPELEIELAPDAEAIAAYGDGLAQMAGATHGARTIHVHPVGAYSFGVKQARPEKDATVAEAMLRHKAKYEKEGLRRHVEAILLVNQHNHPHVLLLQSGGGGAPATFRLPGGRLRHGEGEVEGLQRKLHNKLSPAEASLRKEWECLDCVARWCRPGFEPNYYPYLPAHVTRPKETRAVFVCQLPEKALFAVPKNSKLLAVPLFELYGNEARYGAIIASIPHLISRYHLNLEEKAE